MYVSVYIYVNIVFVKILMLVIKSSNMPASEFSVAGSVRRKLTSEPSPPVRRTIYIVVSKYSRSCGKNTLTNLTTVKNNHTGLN